MKSLDCGKCAELILSGCLEKLHESFHLEEGEIVTKFPCFVDARSEAFLAQS